MSGQLVDTTIIKEAHQRNNRQEKDAIKSGKCAGDIWKHKAKAAQKDVDAR